MARYGRKKHRRHVGHYHPAPKPKVRRSEPVVKGCIVEVERHCEYVRVNFGADCIGPVTLWRKTSTGSINFLCSKHAAPVIVRVLQGMKTIWLPMVKDGVAYQGRVVAA